MKSFKFLPIGIIAAMAILITSCTKPVEDNLPGTWKLSMSVSVFGLSDTQTGTATFNEDGTGSWTIGDDSDDITWSSSDDEITISAEDEAPLTLDVITNKKDEQEWTGTFTESEDGLSITANVTVNLTK